MGGFEAATADHAALRRVVLAVCVLQDLDLEPLDEGVRTTSGRVLPWAAVAAGLDGVSLEAVEARVVLASWLRSVQALAWRSPDDLRTRARAVGLPAGHVLHGGDDWVLDHVRGGAIDLGLGLVGVGPDPDEVVVPRPGVLAALGHDADAWWPACVGYLEDMGRLAAARHELHPERPLRPMGDCDVATLLASAALRASLVAKDPTGMRAAAVPTRNRGWLDLSRTDPAFALAAASLADPLERGFERPLLITADEVVLARPGGDPVLQALRDGAAPDPVLPPVRYR
jgi:hypothetical protein